MCHKTGHKFLSFCHNPRVWKTDRQTDKHRDGQKVLAMPCVTLHAVAR